MGIVRCPNCVMRVIPKQDGTCPHCRMMLTTVSGGVSARPTKEYEARKTHEPFRPKRKDNYFQKYLNRLFGLTEPLHNEITTFLTALTCIILLVSNPEFREFMYALVYDVGNVFKFLDHLIFGLVALFGFLISILHIFLKRSRTSFERDVTDSFKISINAFVAIQAGMEQLNSGITFLFLFPLANVIIGLILMYQARSKTIEIKEENASLIEVMISSMVLFLVFVVAYLLLDLTWAMTFSVCMFYSCSVFILIRWTRDELSILSAT